MSTRSLTYVKDTEGNVLVAMYRHSDGYPSGHGAELLDFIKPIKLVNGLTYEEVQPIANGMGCFAAQMVAHFKNEPGQFYLYRTSIKPEDCGADYYYVIQPNKCNSKLVLTGFNAYEMKEVDQEEYNG